MTDEDQAAGYHELCRAIFYLISAAERSSWLSVSRSMYLVLVSPGVAFVHAAAGYVSMCFSRSTLRSGTSLRR
jgi:hypothetical protein